MFQSVKFICRPAGLGAVVAGLCLFAGCKKFVQVGAPTTSLDGSTVYSNNSTAAAAVTFVYDNMMNGNSFSSGGTGLSMLGGLQADELVNYVPANTTYAQFFGNALTSSNIYFWNELYQYVYVANATIQGLSNSPSVTPALNQQLTGEARFIRAFCMFYLTQLYGDVPMPTTTNYQTNNQLPRTPKAQVMAEVIQDLITAQGLLPNGYVSATGASTSERTRPNRSAATALLARAYLYTEDWKDAESQATALVSGNPNYSLVSILDNVFLANSTEAIWQLEPVQPDIDTFDAFYFTISGGPNDLTSAGMSPFLLEAFEAGDQRAVNWVGVDSSTGTKYYFPYKYKVGYGQGVSEYQMVLRLGEQFLIRAEARAEQGNILGGSGALADLNSIRSRAGLGAYLGATDSASVMAAILHERQVELFTEWGSRWLDLIRTGNITHVMDSVEPAKGGNWSTDWELDPIPTTEISINPKLTQNPGYL